MSSQRKLQTVRGWAASVIVIGERLMSSLRKTAQQGFTLIELLVVILILSILTAIAVPTYLDYTAKAQVATAISTLNAYQQKAVEYYQANGSPPANRAAIGFSATATDGGSEYVSEVQVTNGQIILAMGNSASGALTGVGANAIAFDMLANGDGVVQFKCRPTGAATATAVTGMSVVSTGTGGTNVPARYLPSNCQ